MKKALSVIVSAIILIAVSVVAIAIVLAIGLPALDRAKEALLISEAKDIMQMIDNAVREVIFEGQGSQRVIQIVSSGGDYFVESATDSIKFKLTAISDVISPGTYKKEGNLIISAGTDVKAYEKDYLNDSSLVGYWKLNTANSTNHTLDTSSYKNDGKLYKYPCNPATCNFTTGKIGNALSFDGSNDYVNIGNFSVIDGKNNWAIEMWVYKKNTGLTQRLITRMITSSPYTGWSVEIINTDETLRLDSNGGPASFSSIATVPLNTWTHIVVTQDSAIGIKMYFNGAEGGTSSSTTALATPAVSNTYLGIWSDLTQQPLNGSIDEVRIYNRSLRADEIRQNYYRGLKGRETGTNLVLENERLKFEVPKIGNSSNLTAVNTSTLIDIITVKETGLNITPADSAVRIENDAGSMAGSGYTELTKTGELLREASIKAFVNSTAADVSYEIYYTLRSNADFVLQEIRNIIYS